MNDKKYFGGPTFLTREDAKSLNTAKGKLTADDMRAFDLVGRLAAANPLFILRLLAKAGPFTAPGHWLAALMSPECYALCEIEETENPEIYQVVVNFTIKVVGTLVGWISTASLLPSWALRQFGQEGAAASFERGRDAIFEQAMYHGGDALDLAQSVMGGLI